MQNEIEQLVSQLTGNATMFTAFDITMMLRRANPSTNIRHGEVRDTVHNLFQSQHMTGYLRNTIRLNNGKEALVYHPFDIDSEDYDPNFLAQSTPQFLSIPTVSGIPIQAAVNNPTTLYNQPSVPASWTRPTTTSPTGNGVKPKRAKYPSDAVPKDKFGRVRVPAFVMRASGFKPMDKVRVILDPNIITVTSDTDPNGVLNGREYVVDAYNNIRVHLRGKFQADKFKMVNSSTRVFITPV